MQMARSILMLMHLRLQPLGLPHATRLRSLIFPASSPREALHIAATQSE
jgi:hypothetical protein